METKEVKAPVANSKTNSVIAKAGANGVQDKPNQLTPNTNFDKEKDAPEVKSPEAKPAGKTPEIPTPANQPAPAIEKPKEEKEEIKLVKPALNLEGTLKLVEELHRRKIQRDKLLETINTLEAFEVAQQEESDTTESNHFQGCILTIEDDERRKFSTKNPVIIQAVAQYVNSLCVNRLAEIEAGITIPA